ncbi:MAG: DUF547 domain-containing protein [Cyclobacteriaceae bacterium]|nr:DUF547 domain-containing protein [Cyclobacteriaceae bacterium]
MTRAHLLLLAILFFMQQCTGGAPSQPGTEPMDHQRWSTLLQKHVQEHGLVDYRGFAKDSTALNAYLAQLVANAPNEKSWSESDQIAYWINAYNAFTIKLVMDHYPVPSIKDIGSSVQIPFVNTPWDIKFIEINGTKLDLNNIEHDILRKKFVEPRIHFAINCASISCPALRREAYTGDKLEKQLQAQAIAFINDHSKNDIRADKAEISRIFRWFKGDFISNNRSLREYLNLFAEVPVADGVEISFMDYDWSLNEAGVRRD